MLNVVLDTNVLVSALWSANGTPAKIAHMIPEGKLIPYYCAEILWEYSTVLSRPRFNFQPNQVDALIANIEKFGKMTDVEMSTIPLPDESDRIFYDVAVTNKALLVTGNMRHFPVEPFIVTPADLLAML